MHSIRIRSGRLRVLAALAECAGSRAPGTEPLRGARAALVPSEVVQTDSRSSAYTPTFSFRYLSSPRRSSCRYAVISIT